MTGGYETLYHAALSKPTLFSRPTRAKNSET